MLRATFALVALCLGLSLVAAQPPAAAPAVTMDDIKKAWQERQDKVKTLKMSWKTLVTRPKGYEDFVLGSFVRAGYTNITSPQPPRDLRLPGETDFVLAGDRFRFDSRRDAWMIASQSVKPHRLIATFDGTDYRHTENSPEEPEKVRVAVQPLDRSLMQVESLQLKPIWWCVRGSKNVLGKDSLNDYELTGRTIQLRGISCLELEKKSRTSDTVEHLVVTAGSYLPLRYTSAQKGRLIVQIEMEYDPTVGNSLVPRSWRYSTQRKANGSAGESLEAKVLSCEIGGEIADDTFKIETRPGTILLDTRQESLRLAVVLPDGTTSASVDRRSVTTYDDLIAATKPRATRWWWLIGGVGCVVVAGVTFVVGRRRRRTDGQNSQAISSPI